MRWHRSSTRPTHGTIACVVGLVNRTYMSDFTTIDRFRRGHEVRGQQADVGKRVDSFVLRLDTAHSPPPLSCTCAHAR